VKTVKLTTESTGNEGTFGTLLCDFGPPYRRLELKTGELPWRDNKPNLSCLPAGLYKCEWAHSPKRNKNVYFIRENFPDRDAFQIHSGNLCGDVKMSYDSDVEGCILLGKKHGLKQNKLMRMQRAVLESREAVAEFEALMNGETFMLDIVPSSIRKAVG